MPSFAGFAKVKKENAIHEINQKYSQLTHFLLLSFTRDTYTVAARQYVVVILYGDLFHTTIVVIVKSRYIISDKCNRRVLSYFHEKRHVVVSERETNVFKVSKTLI